MKILVLMKRFSSGKDQIKENFGREIRLFSEVQRKGHKVTLLCTDHVKKERISTTLNGMKVEVYPFGMGGFFRFLAVAKKMAAQNDVVVGTSHPLHGLIAVLAAKGKPVAYDVRDNYETYDFTNLPLLKKGIIPRLVNSYNLRKSKLVTCASPSLAKDAKRKTRGAVTVITNGIDLKLYRPLPSDKCRKMLKLPSDWKIITYSGGIRGTGVGLLIEAFEKVSAKDPKARLMLIGDEIKSKYSDLADKSGGKIIVVDAMPYERLLYYLNASDVLTIAYESNEFTKAMFTPYKLMDYMAVEKPIVCSDVGEMRKMLGDDRLICKPGDASDMAEKISIALKMKKASHRTRLKEFTWQKLGEKLEKAIVTMAGGQ